MLRRNVLIFHQGALGDFVLTWPLAMALARLYPQSRVRYITPAGKGKLIERALGLEWVDVEEGGWHALYAPGAEWLGEGSRRMLAGSHQVISFIADDKHVWSDNILQIAEIAPVLLHPKPLPDYPGHMTQYLLEQLSSQPVIHAAMKQMLTVSHERGLAGLWQPNKDVLIHPGSGSVEKCWPLDRFLDLANRLKRDGIAVKFVLGEVERERWPADQWAAMRHTAEIIEPEGYVALLECLTHSALFIGNDSGPGHLAAILGVPTITLFGNTSPTVWQPIGPKVCAIASADQAPIDVESVYQLVKSMLA